MKIMQVVAGMNIGGIETFLMNIYRNIDRKKYEIIFLVYGYDHYDYEDEILSSGGKILRVPSPRDVSVPTFTKELYKVIKKENVDVVHCHTYFNSAPVMMAAAFAKVPVRLCHSHTALIEKKTTSRIKGFIFRSLVSIFATDKIACSKKAGVALYRNNKFKVITNGIDFNKFYFNETKRKQYRKDFHIKDSDFVIGHVGRLDTPKNHKFLLEIFHEILKEKPNSKLVLVGTGPLEENIKTQAKELKIDKNILFLGNRSDVGDILNLFDIFVFPSIYEGLPLSLVEAQANGLPILVSDQVSPEIKLSDAIHFYELTKTKEQWAHKILNMKIDRIDTKEDLLKSDYSIQSSIEELLTIYQK